MIRSKQRDTAAFQKNYQLFLSAIHIFILILHMFLKLNNKREKEILYKNLTFIKDFKI